MDWFRNLTGFAESSHDDARRRLRVGSGRLYSTAGNH